MSNDTPVAFLLGIGLLVAAVVFETPVAAGGGAAIMMVGLLYSYVVTKRDSARARSYDIDLSKPDFEDRL